MIRWLRTIFQRHHTPPPPQVEMTSDAEKRRMDDNNREITARLERLRLVAETVALRQIEDAGR